MSDQSVIYEVKEHVAWLTLNREERRNALSVEMVDLLLEYLKQAEQDEQVRVLCLTGAGEKAFCSGADLLATMGSDDALAGARKYAALLKTMAAWPKPIVARLNGHCLAGGMGLMLTSDIAYAPEGIKIGTPEVNVGLFPMMIGALIFRNAVRKQALEMIFTARMYTPAEAQQMGLITRVFPADELDQAVEDALSTIAEKGPVGVRLGKEALVKVEDMDLDDALDYLCEQLGEVVKTEDAMEGIAAFMQKRKPVWKGR